MKKAISIILTGVLTFTCLTSCFKPSSPSEETSIDVLTASPVGEGGISNADYCRWFPIFSYNSVEDLYTGIRDIHEHQLNMINNWENEWMDDTLSKTRVTKDERRNGIYGNVRNRLIAEKRMLIPYYQGEPLPLIPKNGGITVMLTDHFRKPWISYVADSDVVGVVAFCMMFIEEGLVNEANEKGASWLMSKIEPDGVNVYNYDTIRWEDTPEFPEISGTRIYSDAYEKEYRLGDRTVSAMVVEKIKFNERPRIFFVYDDILVMACGDREDVEAILPDITFFEVDLPTNTAVRKTPGREDSVYSDGKTQSSKSVGGGNVSEDVK